MIDFGALPPEINSGRMWTDIVGSEPLAEAGAAWQALAAMLGSSSAAMSAVVAELTGGSWLGPSSMAMAAAAAPFAVWLAAHAAQAEETALMAIHAATVFETARVSHVQPAIIAENRAELATLVATNFLGQNTPAIGANEALYSEYWAQDAAAMYGYAADGAGITGVLAGSPFLPPGATADPAGLAGQAAAGTASSGQSAVGGAMGSMASAPTGMGAAGGMGSMSQMMGMVPQALQSLTSPLQSLMSPLSSFGSMLQPLMGMGSMMGAGVAPIGALGSLGGLNSFGGGGLGSPGVMASMGRSAALPGATGPRLSVPQSWAEGVRTVGVVARPADQAVVEAAPAADSTVVGRGGMMPMGALNALGANNNAGNTTTHWKHTRIAVRATPDWPV
jgi:PPE-repeat protein